MKTLDSPISFLQSRLAQRSDTAKTKCNERHLKNRILCRSAKELFHAAPSFVWCITRLIGIQPGNGASLAGFFTLTSLSRCSIPRTVATKPRCGTDSLEKSEAPAAAGLRQLVGALQVKYQPGVTLSATYLRYVSVQVLFLALSAGGYALIVSRYGEVTLELTMTDDSRIVRLSTRYSIRALNICHQFYDN